MKGKLEDLVRSRVCQQGALDRLSCSVIAFALAASLCGLPSIWAAPAQEAYIKASNTGVEDHFGDRVAVSGNTMVIGALTEDSNATGVNGNQSNNSEPSSGAAYVFVRNGTNWIQQAYLKASNSGGVDYFGSSVAISGDTVVVGAFGEDSNATGVNGDQTNNSAFESGAAYVFVRSGTNWTQQAYLKASNTEFIDDFGSSVGVSGDTIVIGAPLEASSATGVNGDQTDNSAPYAGAAYVFVRKGTNWSQQAYLKASNTKPYRSFGGTVAISGDTLVVGCGDDSSTTGINGNQNDTNAPFSGAAYVFVRSGTNWTLQAYLKASNTEAEDGFGASSVAVSGDTVVIGATGEDSSATGVNGNQTDNSATNSGAVYVFVRTGTNWIQQAYLKASNAGGPLPGEFYGDAFGRSVAISGDLLVVGAYGESSSSSGVNADQNDNSAPYSGAAYVFVRSGTNWTQQVYLKASNPGTEDYFGESVAISGDTVIVGAGSEDSNATGVNGDQNDNSATDSGAAYVFTGLGIGPRLALGPDGSGGYLIRFAGAPDVTYRLQRASSVAGPWDTLAMLTAPLSGMVEFHDATSLPGQAFYRTAQAQP